MEIRIPKSDEEILAGYSVLKQLRPNLIKETFVSDVRKKQEQGFRLVFLYEPDVRAVAGYRELEMFATGKMLYVDDLVTDAGHRSKGYGKALLNWLLSEAKRLGCNYLNLDSGLKRVDAHRFYQKNGFEEITKHFSIPIGGTPKWTSS